MPLCHYGALKLIVIPCIGNPEEYTVLQFAQLIKELVGSNSTIQHLPSTEDDPKKRKPDISIAQAKIGWKPVVEVKDGIRKTIEYFKNELIEMGEVTPTGEN